MGTKKTQIALIKCVRGGSEDQKTRKKPARKWHFLRFEPSAGQYIHTYTYIYIYIYIIYIYILYILYIYKLIVTKETIWRSFSFEEQLSF